MSKLTSFVAALLVCLALGYWLGGYHVRHKPTADELYGCTIEQQAPTGDCK